MSSQGIAAAHSVRVTFLSGDVHVGAFGCFQAHPKEHIRVVDPKFMLQVRDDQRHACASAAADRAEDLHSQLHVSV